MPGSTTEPRSSCAASTPVSTTATVTPGAAVADHAGSNDAWSSAHCCGRIGSFSPAVASVCTGPSDLDAQHLGVESGKRRVGLRIERSAAAHHRQLSVALTNDRPEPRARPTARARWWTAPDGSPPHSGTCSTARPATRGPTTKPPTAIAIAASVAKRTTDVLRRGAPFSCIRQQRSSRSVTEPSRTWRTAGVPGDRLRAFRARLRETADSSICTRPYVNCRVSPGPRDSLTSGSVPQGAATNGAIDAEGPGARIGRANRNPRGPEHALLVEPARHRPGPRRRRNPHLLQPVGVRRARLPAGRARGNPGTRPDPRERRRRARRPRRRARARRSAASADRGPDARPRRRMALVRDDRDQPPRRSRRQRHRHQRARRRPRAKPRTRSCSNAASAIR